MPLPWSKSNNRSHSSVDTSSGGQPSPVPSIGETSQRFPTPHDSQHQAQHPPVQQLPAGVPQSTAYRQQPFPQRTTSYRHSAHLSQQDFPIPGPQQQSPGLEQRRGSYQPQSPAVNVQEPKKPSLRSRIAAGLTGHKEEEPLKQKNGIGRRVSVRKSGDPRAQEFQSQDTSRLQAAQWSQRQGSSPHLPASNEHDEDNLDPFLQQEEPNPQVPPKDIQFVSDEQYNRPSLNRVNTEGSHTQPRGVDNSPQHQQQHQPQAYQTYAPPQQQHNPNEYQAFNPNSQGVPSPHPGNASQLHAQNLAEDHSNYYHYQQPQAQAPVQNNSPQDIQSGQFQQPQQFPLQPHQGQEFQLQHAQGRPSSQHLELHQPQATHQVPQIVQQGQRIDSQNLQLRPPSQQQLGPPSPLQPPQYHAYESQQGHQPQPNETHAQNTTPPQQGQDTMGPPNSQGRNTLRKVNEAGQPQSGAPSRESSHLQSPPAGQAQPVSPGIPTFGANVVPAASQGQPYRGEKGGQQGGNGDLGRATPPPRTATDMTDDEISSLVKEHEVLREKYQKVKRYFFEQQSQVHQLQNTLANQRLSLSRTSWDDSEYATRFSRLDGLIAQLSFSIRKDWKSIPPWLHTVVNKNAVETGKQEMTAVGRAFISCWLVENIFDKYFHPDLEPGLSTQLKLIQLNIRRFAPTCHTPEDEDGLNAKIINWRLATLEGLRDQLQAAQSSANRQSLIETLNEKLIGSLQMLLNDPAPPDLNGGVPMIVELAVSIAQHLPLESREVQIEYFPPGHGIVSECMKMESGIPALTSPILEHDDADRASVRSVASKMDDNSSLAEEQSNQSQSSQPPKEVADKKRSMFGFGSSKKPTQPPQLGKRESSLGQGGSQQSLTQAPPGSSSGPKDEPPPRVRLAVGVAVQIRGKSVLIKAPTYST